MSYFGRADVVAEATVSSIGTSETDVLTITDISRLTDNQFTVLFDPTLGTHTSLEFRYYALDKVGGTWYQFAYKNETTGAMANLPSVHNASSPTEWYEEVAVPGCFGFKVTIKGVGGANGAATVRVLSRNN